MLQHCLHLKAIEFEEQVPSAASSNRSVISGGCSKEDNVTTSSRTQVIVLGDEKQDKKFELYLFN